MASTERLNEIGSCKYFMLSSTSKGPFITCKEGNPKSGASLLGGSKDSPSQIYMRRVIPRAILPVKESKTPQRLRASMLILLPLWLNNDSH